MGDEGWQGGFLDILHPLKDGGAGFEERRELETETGRVAAGQDGRAGRGADRTALGLVSPVLSRHVTGQRVVVSGGMEGRVLWDADEISAAE